jgi:hypothetical protein
VLSLSVHAPLLSVVTASMWCMAGKWSLRRIGDPVVAAGPAGVRIRTRIEVTDAEAAALGAVGTFLGSVYRDELAGRIGCGVLDRDGRAVWRAERKQAISAVSSSRWAGAITRAVEDQYQLGMRCLAGHLADLRAAVEALAARCALRPGEREPEPADDEHGSRRGARRRRGYRSTAERFAKTRRLAALRERLAGAEKALAAGHPSIAVGGKRLWRTRNHLDAAAGQARSSVEPRWQARQFRPTDTPTMRLTGPPENTRSRGQHRSGRTASRTHSYSLTRNGVLGLLVDVQPRGARDRARRRQRLHALTTAEEYEASRSPSQLPSAICSLTAAIVARNVPPSDAAIRTAHPAWFGRSVTAR